MRGHLPALAALLCSSALPQAAPAPAPLQTAPLEVEAIRGPVRHAGIYNVATGQWTRRDRGAAQNRGPQAETIYSQTASGGVFFAGVGPTGAQAGGVIVDAGAVPGPSNPGPFFGTPDREFYRTDRIVLGYCDFDTNPGVAGWAIDVFGSYDPAAGAVGTPDASYAITGLPSNGCWIVEIQLDGCLQADGGLADPGWDNDPDRDSFGVSMGYIGSGIAAAGPILAGDPANTDPSWSAGTLPRDGTGTYYGMPGPGTGYLNRDELLVTGFGGPAGTIGGGYVPGPPGSGPASPWAGLFLELKAAGSCNPAGAISQPGCAGVPNATGAPGALEAFGNLDLAQNDCRLEASSLPPGQFGIFIVGLNELAPGQIIVGNGDLCISPTAGGGLGRFTAPNQIRLIDAQGQAVLDSSAGDWTTTSIPIGGTLVQPAFAETTYFQFWHREAAGAGSNLTASCSVTWL